MYVRSLSFASMEVVDLLLDLCEIVGDGLDLDVELHRGVSLGSRHGEGVETHSRLPLGQGRLVRLETVHLALSDLESIGCSRKGVLLRLLVVGESSERLTLGDGLGARRDFAAIRTTA